MKKRVYEKMDEKNGLIKWVVTVKTMFLFIVFTQIKLSEKEYEFTI